MSAAADDGPHPHAAGRRWLEPAAVLVVVLAVYLAATPRTNQAYRHFVYMARGFLQGRVDLPGVPAYYHDVIHLGGRTYAPFPPVPALLLLPAVALWGEATDQGRVGQTVAALAVAVFVAALRRMGIPPAVRLFCGAALAFGSVLWPAAAIGTTWFFAQEVVVLATALLVWELAGGARPFVLSAVAVGGWLTRVTVLLAAPALGLLLWLRHRRPAAVVAFLAANAAGALVYLTYNLLRFGDPLQTGYGMLSMAAPNAQAVARWGFFNLRYVPQHLYAMLLRPPELMPTPPYLRPSPWGMSLLLTSPFVVRLLFPHSRAGWARWATLVGCMALPMLLYFSVGWVQFGYRYSLDWWVFLLVMLAVALGDRPRPVDYALLALSVAMNGLGVYWVRVLGW
ncbi:MAG: hypothetical protein QN152_04885 [Armatimonadota bacterium]|nr:hypothetical protein [Armatimonadota bacterium]MDR7428144.1 hypothetical protein [Armatimonadota bacterium]MDR7463708.1 hypothetical protein [Armatimonadota bacterium]MDR7470199.1 hypothetical protein [Armatimonadota bacterium]MDR7473627.1 hypothetical protein [Armatimonadota bacterium]